MLRLGVNSGIKVNTKATFERLFKINADTFLRQWSIYSVILFSKKMGQGEQTRYFTSPEPFTQSELL